MSCVASLDRLGDMGSTILSDLLECGTGDGLVAGASEISASKSLHWLFHSLVHAAILSSLFAPHVTIFHASVRQRRRRLLAEASAGSSRTRKPTSADLRFLPQVSCCPRTLGDGNQDSQIEALRTWSDHEATNCP
jgi:hypothetical protein